MASPVLRQSTALGAYSGTASTHALSAFGSSTLAGSRVVAWVGVCNNQLDGIGVSMSGYTALGTAVRQASGHDAVTTYAFEKLNTSGTASPGTVTYTGLGTVGATSWAIAHEITGDGTATPSTVLASGVGFSTAPVIGPTTATSQPGVLLLAALTSPNIQVTSLASGSLFSQVAAGGTGGGANSASVTALVAQESLAAVGTDTLNATVIPARQYAGLIIGVPGATGGGGGGGTAGPQQFPLGPPDTTGYTVLDDPGIAAPSKLAALWQPTLSNSVDYVLNCPTQRTAGIAIIGGRNVVVPRLDIKMAATANVMVSIGGGAAGGIVHLDTFHLDPNGNECDAIKTVTGSSGRILQLKTGRIEKLIGHTAGVHADVFQSSGGIGNVWVEDLTAYTTYDGFMLQREANIEQQTTYFSVTAGSVIGGTAYEMTSPNHTYVAGDPVAQWGLTPSSYNGGYTVLSVSGSGSTKKYVVKKGDPSPGTVSAAGHVTKMSFGYNVGSINLNRVNVKGFASVYGGTAVPPEALQSIRFGARPAPAANAGNPGTVLPGYTGHPNEDQTPLNIDQWAGTLTATNWWAMPPPSTSTVGLFVEPDAGTVNYSVIRPVDHVAAGTVPAYCDWPLHPNVSGRLNFGTPPAGDYVIMVGGVPTATAAGGGTPSPPAAPVNTTVPGLLPANPLDTDTLTVATLGTWSGTDDTSLYTVNFYHRLGSSGSYGSAVSTVGPTDPVSALAATQALTSAEDGYQWRIGVVADNGTPGSEAFSLPTGLVVQPITVTLEVTVE
jgi:hypothetical protein